MRNSVGPVALIAAGAGLYVLLGASPADAYVRKLTEGGVPEYWQASCTTVTVYLNGFTMMTRDEVAAAIAGAAHAWSPQAITCPDGRHPYFEIVVSIDADPGASVRVGNDSKNAIIFETQDDAPDSRIFFDDTMIPNARIAVTSPTPKADGRVLDADIRVNATAAGQLEWGDIDPNGPTHLVYTQDLQTALTHEFGHFVGLDHTCRGDLPIPLDDAGKPIPNCGNALPAVQDTVMWPSIGPGVVKRVLTDDEVSAMCAIYPAAADPHDCALDKPDDGVGCSLGVRSPRSAAGVLGALAALALSRRRPRCARRVPTPRRA